MTKKAIYFFNLLLWTILATAVIAQSHYPGQHAGKFVLEDKLKPALYSFDLQDVKLLNSRFTENMEREQQGAGMNEPVKPTKAVTYSGKGLTVKF